MRKAVLILASASTAAQLQMATTSSSNTLRRAALRVKRSLCSDIVHDVKIKEMVTRCGDMVLLYKQAVGINETNAILHCAWYDLENGASCGMLKCTFQVAHQTLRNHKAQCSYSEC